LSCKREPPIGLSSTDNRDPAGGFGLTQTILQLEILALKGGAPLFPQEFENLDSITLCKLLTTIVRADRFNDGLMISYFNDGTISAIIQDLKKQS